MAYTVSELFPMIKAQAGSAGVCTEDALMDRMNVVGPEILKQVEAKGTVTTWCLAVCSRCVVLPADLDTPLQAWICGKPLGFRGEYWLGRLGGNIGSDMGQEVPWQELVMDGRSVYTQVYPVPATCNDVFEVVARSQKDAGKQLDIRYRDSAGRLITWKPTLLGSREGSDPTETGISDLEFVSKPRTVGAVELWMRNLRNGNKFLVAVYDGYMEKPEYKMIHITGCANGRLTIKGKKKWTQLRSTDDVVPFGGAAVWRTALIAEAFLANRKTEQYRGTIAQAVEMLVEELAYLRPPATAEVVDFITPWSIWNKSPLQRR